jgi:ribosomal protein S18 acetylase RimI-like enzyme
VEFAIRMPGPADEEELALLHVSTWQEAYGHLLPDGFFDEAHLEGRRRQWRSILSSTRDDVVVRVAEEYGKLIGFAFAGPALTVQGAPPRARQLYMLYLSRDRYGSGAGQALLDAVLGDEPAQLWVAEQNPRAIAFYRRNGFVFDGVEQTDATAPLITEARMIR